LHEECRERRRKIKVEFFTRKFGEETVITLSVDSEEIGDVRLSELQSGLSIHIADSPQEDVLAVLDFEYEGKKFVLNVLHDPTTGGYTVSGR